jgi:hypothetical protein
MLPTAHFLSGVLIFSILSYAQVIPLGFPCLAMILLFSIIPDIDFIITPLHRNLFTHTPFFWGIVAAITLIINQNMWIILPALTCHLFLDTLDYGAMIAYPFTLKKYGLSLLGKEPNGKTKSSQFLRQYINNRKMQFGEISILAMAIIAWCLNSL